MLEAALPPGSRVPWLPHELRLGPRGAPRRGWMPIEEGPRGALSVLPVPDATRTFAHTDPRSHMQAEPAAAEPTTAEPAAAAAEAQTLALEQRCAKLEAELTALRVRLHEAEARYQCHTARAT